MKVDWKGLAQGIYNSVLGAQWIKDLGAVRYENFCRPCSYNSTNAQRNNGYRTARPDEHCTDCGCNLHWKVLQLSSSCPRGLWKAEVTKQQAETIGAIINNVPTTKPQDHADDNGSSGSN